jgi:hypothetical protein
LRELARWRPDVGEPLNYEVGGFPRRAKCRDRFLRTGSETSDRGTHTRTSVTISDSTLTRKASANCVKTARRKDRRGRQGAPPEMRRLRRPHPQGFASPRPRRSPCR